MTVRHTAEQRARGRWTIAGSRTIGLPVRLSEDTRPEMIRNRNGSPVAEACVLSVAEAIVRALNEHDALVDEVERVTRQAETNFAMWERRNAEAAGLRERNQQLRDALRLLVEHTPLDILSYEQAREIARAALGDGEQQCERQPVERLTWRDAKVGGRVAIAVYGPPDGWEDVYRTVIAIDWPTIRLRDEQTGREYEIDASSEKEHRRSIRRVPSSLPARAALGDGEPPETAAKPACGRPISSESVAGDGEQHG